MNNPDVICNLIADIDAECQSLSCQYELIPDSVIFVDEGFNIDLLSDSGDTFGVEFTPQEADFEPVSHNFLDTNGLGFIENIATRRGYKVVNIDVWG